MQIETVSQIGTNAALSHSATPEIVRRDRQAPNPQSSAKQEARKVAPEEVLRRIKELTDGGAQSVRFEMDKDLNVLVIRMYDSQTDELIRQIPAESLLETTKALQEYRRGLIVDNKL